ncbi:histidine phosphatase family protein [Paenibacillus allorhizosphaerae]|uniref:Histidine phosphatase family protein n=1 Tax=Paenibacillus allorhizosphaerae TaxID=2849866 RepID=A0ABM8VQX6_9BACL|nr:histidine phosphatase family protein [Paenibacillus allorhizosphaerae]CAG7654738.1 hypothetical protein PAECIP111802_05856 [Paenibacillus allorhizosphaerae]
MTTYIYMVRHGESPKTEGSERTRGLMEKGKSDACRITELLTGEGIEVYVSSPYRRAILTIEESARRSGQEILQFEELKEQKFSNEDIRMPDNELMPLLKRSFSDPSFALPGGETNHECQNRAITVLKQLLTTYQGRRIAVGTHGAVMTLTMGYYDKRYDLDFLLNTTKPDVYRMEFIGQQFVGVKRLWI